jgi:hypothetical protein
MKFFETVKDLKLEKSNCENNECKNDCEAKFMADNVKVEKLTNRCKLYVIAVVSNPARFAKRYKLFQEFCDRMACEEYIELVTIELQQKHRPFVTDSLLRFRTNDEIWYKENLINLAIKYLPSDWEYVAWVDTDIEFQNKDWALETIELLQTYKVVQMFSHAIDMGERKETLHVHTGFAYQYVNGETWRPAKYGCQWHPGYAWACTRSAFDGVGGLIDFSILGSADNHMALSFIGLVEKSLHSSLNPNYKLLCKIFQERCEKHIKRSLGFLPGTILHYFHGNKPDRQYQDRWKILINNDFDPLRDIVKDYRGLYQLQDDKIKLRDDIIMYFRTRNEDVNVVNSDYKYVKKHYI